MRVAAARFSTVSGTLRAAFSRTSPSSSSRAGLSVADDMMRVWDNRLSFPAAIATRFPHGRRSTGGHRYFHSHQGTAAGTFYPALRPAQRAFFPMRAGLPGHAGGGA